MAEETGKHQFGLRHLFLLTTVWGSLLGFAGLAGGECQRGLLWAAGILLLGFLLASALVFTILTRNDFAEPREEGHPPQHDRPPLESDVLKL